MSSQDSGPGPPQKQEFAADPATTQDISPSFAPEHKVAGRYRIEARLGSGGFGEVFRAHDELLNRTVSLKVVSLEKGDGAEKSRLDDALKEARTVARLDHPNIVPVYDVGVEANKVWIAMKLVQGEDCGAILKQSGRMAPERALSILRQVAIALDHAHGKGVIHRDVKPANMVLERRGDGSEHVWLVDFGIAKILTGQTIAREGAITGTPHYMSPEQITGKRVDARTDIFAFGCVAFELIAGKRAFTGVTYAEVLYKIVHQPPEGLSELDALAGSRFAAVARRALAKAPEDRFETAREMLQALDALSSEVDGGRKKSIWAIFRRPLHAPADAAWDGREVLVASDLIKGYRFRQRALDGMTLNVSAGSICALLGRNGSGKTTFIRTVLGIYRPDSGLIRIFGREPHRDRRGVLSRIGYVPETFAAYESLTVGQYIAFLRSFYPKWDNAYCYHLLGSYGLPLETKIRDLSKGTKTKVSLVGALSHRPEFLILDDPTIGLDAATSREVFETLQEACRQEAATVLISSHNLDEVETVATHVAFIERGRVLIADTLAALRTRTREVTLTFRDALPDLRGIEHFKVVKSSGSRLTGLLLDTSSQALQQLEGFQPEQLQVKELNLKELFVHFLREPPGRGPN